MQLRLFVVSAVDLQASITPVRDGDGEVLAELRPATFVWRTHGPAGPQSALYAALGRIFLVIMWGNVVYPAIERHLPVVHWAAHGFPRYFTPAAARGLRHA